MCGISCGKFLRELQDLFNLGRSEHAANPLGMNDGKGRLNEITLFDFFPFDDEVLQEAQKLQLPTVEIGVLGNKVIKGLGDGFGKAGEDFYAQDMANELDKACSSISVNNDATDFR